MKKLLIGIVLLLLSVAVFAGGLNSSANSLKANHPDIYQAIRDRAVREWDDDHDMVVYEINRQSTALYESSTLLKSNPDITSRALFEWADSDILGVENVFIYSIDWVMVVYTAKKQIESQSSY